MANSASWEKIFKDNKILEHDFSKTPFYLSAKEIKEIRTRFQKYHRKRSTDIM